MIDSTTSHPAKRSRPMSVTLDLADSVNQYHSFAPPRRPDSAPGMTEAAMTVMTASASQRASRPASLPPTVVTTTQQRLNYHV